MKNCRHRLRIGFRRSVMVAALFSLLASPIARAQTTAAPALRLDYIASAIDNPGADPEGEFWGGVAADPVYRLLGTDGLPTTQWRPVNHSVMGQIDHHVRSGIQDVTPFDWGQYLDFADMHLKPRKRATAQ